MRRKPLGRSAGLTARMIFVLVLIALTLTATAAGLISLFFIVPTWSPLWALVICGLVVSTAREYRRAEEALLDVAQARLVDESKAPERGAPGGDARCSGPEDCDRRSRDPGWVRRRDAGPAAVVTVSEDIAGSSTLPNSRPPSRPNSRTFSVPS